MLILFIIISLHIIIGLKAGINNFLLNEFKKLDIDVNLIVVPVILLIVYILNRIHSVHDTVLKKINPTTRATTTRAATTRAATTRAATTRAATFPPPPPTRAATTTTNPTTTMCVDHNKSCAMWAREGGCTANPSYMQKSCCLSCSTDSNTRTAKKYPYYPLLTPKLPDIPGCYWIAPTSCEQIPVPMNEWRYIPNSTKSGHIDYELCRDKFSYIENICGTNRVQIRYVPFDKDDTIRIVFDRLKLNTVNQDRLRQILRTVIRNLGVENAHNIPITFHDGSVVAVVELSSSQQLTVEQQATIPSLVQNEYLKDRRTTTTTSTTTIADYDEKNGVAAAAGAANGNNNAHTGAGGGEGNGEEDGYEDEVGHGHETGLDDTTPG